MTTIQKKAQNILRQGWISWRDLMAELGCSVDEVCELLSTLGAREVPIVCGGYGWTLVDHAPPPRRGGMLDGQWYPDL